jgi:hypothetical protein
MTFNYLFDLLMSYNCCRKVEGEGWSSSWLAYRVWEVPIIREKATRGPTEDPWGPVRSGGLLQTAERRLGFIPTIEVKFNFDSDRKTQPWKILYACNDNELINVRVHIEENTRKFNLCLNKIIFYWCLCCYLSFILLQVLTNWRYDILQLTIKRNGTLLYEFESGELTSERDYSALTFGMQIKQRTSTYPPESH